eukprot:12139218-Ditylum_brightwellii.AAC.1
MMNNNRQIRKQRELKKHHICKDSEEEDFWHDSSNDDNSVNPPLDTVSVDRSLASNDMIVHEDTTGVVCTYSHLYFCKGPQGAKAPLQECKNKNCIRVYHQDCIEMHLEVIKGVYHENYDKYD